jgi:hypothetical protein
VNTAITFVISKLEGMTDELLARQRDLARYRRNTLLLIVLCGAAQVVILVALAHCLS